ncbi:MAG: DUF4286 family protein [Muribaculaceae bacterium]|jgi:hypothetical protein|nr:DUF4286 family protein [Muribaculaceae bacterium]
MVLTNTTFAVAPEADNTFRKWVKDTFLDNAVKGGGFTAPLFCRIMTDEADCAASYAVQFVCPTIECAREWMESGDGALMLRELRHKAGDSILWFTTYMQIIG